MGWQGWETARGWVNLPRGEGALRLRQAAKLALSANRVQLGGQDVDWAAVEARLEAICSGLTPMSLVPSTVR